LKWGSGNTSTIYNSVASSTVFKAFFMHSWGCWSRNSSAKIPELTTLSYWISRTVRTTALVDYGGLLLQQAIYWSRSSIHTPVVRYIVSWPLTTLIWIDSHPITCYFVFLLHPVLRTIFKCASWVIFLVATIAASQWTNRCLRCRCVSPSGALLEAPVVRLDLALIVPGGSVSGAMACCCRKWERWSPKVVGSAEDYIVSYKSKWNAGQPTCTFNSSWILFQIGALHIAAGDSNGRKICSKSVQSCLYVYRDTLRRTTADISCLIDIERTFFNGKKVCWSVSQDIAGILHESHANYEVIMYC
jgi:hypothetical protein